MRKTAAAVCAALFCAVIFTGCFGAATKTRQSSAAAFTQPSTEAQTPQSATSAATEEPPTAALTTAPENTAKVYEYTVQPIWCQSQKGRIYGEAYVPKGGGRFPLIIASHGLGANLNSGAAFAKRYAPKCYAVYTFDFRGGSTPGRQNRSEGKVLEMSVLTEADDLEAVLDAAKKWNFVDKSRIFLQGASQGGLVSTIVGLRRQSDVAGLVLMYPAFSLYDYVHDMFTTYREVPDKFKLLWMELGRVYARDLWDYDVRDALPEFKKPVLIVHGDEDDVIDVSGSKKAEELFPDCELHILSGAGHGFDGEHFNQAAGFGIDFLETVCGQIEDEPALPNALPRGAPVR